MWEDSDRLFPVSQKLVSKLTDWGQRLTKSEENDPPISTGITVPRQHHLLVPHLQDIKAPNVQCFPMCVRCFEND